MSEGEEQQMGQTQGLKMPSIHAINNRQSLTQVKKAKKQINQDARLLANRIALLKQEEMKTVKKIEETKRKAYQIYRAKQKNEQKQLQKLKLKEQMAKKQDELKKQKEQDQIERENKKQIWQQVKSEHYEQIKAFKQENKEKKEKNEKNVITNLQMKNKVIKQQREQGRQKIDFFQTQKRFGVQQEFAKQYELEEVRRKQKITEVMNMEKLEWDLIQKLQKTQNIQKQAYKELEDAIQLSATQFEDKFIKGEGRIEKTEKTENQQQ